MSKFIKAQDIPADAEAIAFWQDENGTTQVQMSKSVRGAKMIASKHKESPEFGWTVIDDKDQAHGRMVW